MSLRLEPSPQTTQLSQVLRETRVVPGGDQNLRVFGSGRLPTALFSQGIAEERVFLTTKRPGNEDIKLNTDIRIQGIGGGCEVDLTYSIGEHRVQHMSDDDSAIALADKDARSGVNIISTNDQRYRDQDNSPSEFVQNLATYFARRAELFRQGDAILQIAPLELTTGNGQSLYQALVHSLIHKRQTGLDISVGDVLKFLANQCAWYDTIDDRITPTRTLSEPGTDGRYRQSIYTEPYATLHFSKSMVTRQAITINGNANGLRNVAAPFEGSDRFVAEVEDLAPYSHRKLGLLNAVHVFLVIEALKAAGIEKFSQIRDMNHAKEKLPEHLFVKNCVNGKGGDGFQRASAAAKAIKGILETEYRGSGVDFEGFLITTYRRFANPFANHKLIDIFQGMDKFPDKITDRIQRMIDISELSNDRSKFAGVRCSEEYEILKRYASFTA